MFKKDVRRVNIVFLCVIFIGGIVLRSWVTRASGDAANSGAVHTEVRVGPSVSGNRAALQEVSKPWAGGFEPSLEMKENVDFLLTPALLLQEVVSDDVVITYPTE